MFIGNSQKEARYLSFPVSLSGLSPARFKITADILIAIAGEFFTEEIKTQSRYNVVQIEVSFVSTRRDSNKPEKINNSILSGCCL